MPRIWTYTYGKLFPVSTACVTACVGSTGTPPLLLAPSIILWAVRVRGVRFAARRIAAEVAGARDGNTNTQQRLLEE